jgi:hypothetical protein
MNKAELRGRMFHAGIIAAVFIVLAGLGACNAVFVPAEFPGQEDWETGAVDAAGNVAVRVGLPGASGSKSVSDALVPVYVDYYEVIFKSRDDGTYYFGKADAGKSYLSVAVKPGIAYDILLLAGVKANRVLLATGFVNRSDGAGWVDSGPGYTVEAGKANVIIMTLLKTNLTPDGGLDISFTGTNTSDATIVGGFTSTRVDNFAVVVVPTLPSVKEFTVNLSQTKLTDLIRAGSTGDLFVSNRAQLSALYTEEAQSFVPQFVSAANGVDSYTYTFTPIKVDGPGTPIVKKNDIDGRLRLELTYYAFGDSDSKSTLWNIRNGLDYDLDDNGSGGSIVVQFGTGSEFDEYPTIQFGL